MNTDTIPFQTAIHWNIDQKKQKEIDRTAIIEEIKTSNISGMDARDINYYAAESGLEPNEVRRLMIHDEDPSSSFMDDINSFENDETDSIFDYF